MARRKKDWDVLVVGGGPAGMLAAAAASRTGAGVALLEKNSRLGRKMGVTGGGRCNLTNTAPLDLFIKNIPGNGKFVISALSRFSVRDCMEFFNELGVPTREEDGGRVFPATGRAGDVVAALERSLEGSGVKVFYSIRVSGLLVDGISCRGVVSDAGRTFHAKAVVIAMGGASHPRTGSTGDGYLVARQAGHTVEPPLPGLVPLCFAEAGTARRLQGLSIKNTSLDLTGAGGKRHASIRGDVVFTHFGLSGPAALKLSRTVSALGAAGAGRLCLFLDVLPDTGEQALTEKMLSMAVNQPRKSVEGLLKQLVPDRLAVLVAGMVPAGNRKKAGETDKETWRKLSRLIKGLPLDLAGTRPLAEAMVTVGGISTREVDPGTMASRLVDGLYFAGEMLDVDAFTGGFNMQIAFSTGWLAGMSAAAKAGFPGDSRNPPAGVYLG